MKRLSITSLFFFLVSCATQPYQPYAREIKKKPGKEGIIALKTTYVEADRLYADQLMAKNCGTNPYNVLEEGEVSVGETVTKNSQTKKDNSNNFGLDFKGFNLGDSGPKDEVNHAETSTKITLKEWHIGYNCNAEIATNVKEVKSKKK